MPTQILEENLLTTRQNMAPPRGRQRVSEAISNGDTAMADASSIENNTIHQFRGTGDVNMVY